MRPPPLLILPAVACVGLYGFLMQCSVAEEVPVMVTVLDSPSDTVVAELVSDAFPGPHTAPAAKSRGLGLCVNVNTADSAGLDRLVGVGPATAQRIIVYRQEHGAFREPSDLLAVKGIGEKKLAKMLAGICF